MVILHRDNQSLCGRPSSGACQQYTCSQTKSMQMFLFARQSNKFVCLLHQYFIALYCFLCLFCCFLVYPGRRILAYGVIAGRRAHTGELLFLTLIHPPPYSLIQFGLCPYAMAHWVKCYWNPFALLTCGDNNHIKVITANALRSLMWFPLWRFNIFPCTIAEHAVAIWRGKKTSYRLSLLPFPIWSHLSCLVLCLTLSWWCQEITALVYFDSVAFPRQDINRCDVCGMSRIHASLVWRRGWYVVSTAGTGRGKFLWNDNRIGRHIKGLLRTEGNKPNPFHIRFQTDVI